MTKITVGEMLDQLAGVPEDTEVVIVVDGEEHAPVGYSYDAEGGRIAISD